MAAAEKGKKDIQDEEDQEGGEIQPVSKKRSPLVLIVVIVVVVALLAGGGAAAYLLYFKPKPETAVKASVQATKPQVIVFWPMEPFIVNLSDNEGDRFIKVVMQLELSDQKLAEEFRMLTPRLRDMMLDLLSSKTYREMMDPIGKQRLRDEIVMRMNMQATQGKVLNVYFTEFVIQ
jgi:flagellar FliL protein